jgi:hypothetical protein
MARARFVAQGHAGHTCEVFGREFPHGDWVEVDDLDPAHVATLTTNPAFEVEAEPAPAPRTRNKPPEA